MGKKARKTRWRTLTIAGETISNCDNEYSDSEESSTTTTQRLPKGYQPRSYYNKFSYSSQSTPRRRYQHDSTKSTRSSSTASENKITFNEDEYTKITTPRQDVLFKKGYLNKPKNYQTQTSTGTSTTSTGNSTGNGTPDHQSTDLEYESQFVFPNGFVDQNGIYYINSYETYPLMLYNPPTYYPEFNNFKSKRYSTGSLTESTSPNNEEATSQDFSGGEASNNVSDYSGHHHVYNMVYPGYYVNGVGPPHDAENVTNQTDQTRRIKRRRRRKTSSKSQTAQDSSEYTEDENESGNEGDDNVPDVPVVEANPDVDETKGQNEEESGVIEDSKEETKETIAVVEEEKQGEDIDVKIASELQPEATSNIEQKTEEAEEVSNEEPGCTSRPRPEPEEVNDDSVDEGSNTEVHQTPSEVKEDPGVEDQPPNLPAEPLDSQKSELKPDAEEFVPRAYRNSEIPINPNLQFIKVPPSFIPIPIMPIGDFNGQSFNPAAFIPSGIPINFLPPDPKMYPNFVGFVPNPHFLPRAAPETGDIPTGETSTSRNTEETPSCDASTTAKDEKEPHVEKVSDKTLVQTVNNKTIDIATIVSKLEKAAKEQDDNDARKSNQEEEEVHSSPRRRFNENRNNRMSQKYKNIPNYRRNNYNSAQNSPQRNIHPFKENLSTPKSEPFKEVNSAATETTSGPKLDQTPDLCNGMPTVETRINNSEQTYLRRNPENNRRNWKYQGPQNGSPKWQPNSPVKYYRPQQNGKPMFENNIRDYKPNQPNRNYSAMLKNKPTPYVNDQRHYQRQVSEKQKSNQSDAIDTVKSNDTKSPTTSQPRQANQWISVSSRKKRKNKNSDETDVSFEDTEGHTDKDLFEKYDVEQLIDVVVLPSQDEVIKIETAEEIEIGDIINSITQNETSLINNVENISLNLPIRSVNEIERDLIVRDSTEKEIKIETKVIVEDQTENNTDVKEPTVNETTKPDSLTPEVEIVLDEEELFREKSSSETPLETISSAKPKNNKKSKKGVPKPLTKRVIITDVDLSLKCDEIKAAPKKVVTKLDEKPSDVKEVPKVEKKVEEKVAEALPKRDDEDEKKKNKKKKKKSTKTTMTSSLSSSNATLNIMDDSYDFLLDSALSPESVEKTNVEVSQELDKIIQKGMYSSLEGKIKSMNIDGSDGFFKSVFTNISTTKSNTDKNGFNKALDLSQILQDSRSMFRPSSVSQDNNSQNKDINKILPDLDSSVEDGFFLENTMLNDTQDQTATNDMQNEETQDEDMNKHDETGDEAKKGEVEPKTLYPITEAVKEWMCKTRETTPDVEILKSPLAIYKEFCDSASETDTVVSDSTSLADEEVTIFSKESELDPEGTISQQDVMDYWETDLGICENKDQSLKNENGALLAVNESQNEHIEQGEDVLEVYDSKYGKNEDYLNLQEEIKEKIKNTNHAKHGNLPYRAICCSIM